MGSMSLSLFPLLSAERSHAAHMRTRRKASSKALPNGPPDPCMFMSSLLIRRQRLYCARSGDRPAAGGRVLNAVRRSSGPAKLPTAFIYALESWALAIFWRLGSGLEVRENTKERTVSGRMTRDPIDRTWSNVRRSYCAVDSRFRGNDGGEGKDVSDAGSDRIVAFVQQVVRRGIGPGDTV